MKNWDVREDFVQGHRAPRAIYWLQPRPVRMQHRTVHIRRKLRGKGLAEFRREVASGIHDAEEELRRAGVDPNCRLFFMYAEAIKRVAEHSKAGHTLIVDYNPAGPLRLVSGIQTVTNRKALMSVDDSLRMSRPSRALEPTRVGKPPLAAQHQRYTSSMPR